MMKMAATFEFLGVLMCIAFRLGCSVPLWSDVCTQEYVRSLPFCNTSLPLDSRVADYIERIPTESMIPMMNAKAQGFDPLHIPSYQWWSEGLHGPLEPCVIYDGQIACPTSFPCPSALGNAFNASLYHAIGEAIGVEGRAISNLRPHNSNVGDGLTYWSPTLNMQRDPRWGRNQEVPGEDPYLTGQYVSAFVNGLQGQGKQLRVAAACKHFVANSLEKWGKYSRHSFDAHVSEEDLFNYYFPPFRECVKESVGVMCSYNALNGKPACANPWLLKDVLRKKWGFEGYVVSDCGALADIVTGHHFAVDAVQASAMAVNASVDLNCGNGGYYPKGLMQAFHELRVEASRIQDAFARLARVQFRLGLFDPKPYFPDDDIGIVGSHDDLAMNAAQQSIVLLKNERNLLPLHPNQSIAMIGPHIHATDALLSNYHGDPCPNVDADAYYCIRTPLQAIEEANLRPVLAVKGCNVANGDLDEIMLATKAAEEAAVVVLMVGLDQTQESEGLDRYESTLPGLQSKLIEAVLQVASEKTILVMFHGGSVSLGDYVQTKTPAILSLPYGGQAASRALASVLFGDYNPTGKLAATMYPPSYVQNIPLTEMGLKAENGHEGRTHMYYNGPTEFPFGHGLSYSEWRLKWSQQHLNQAPGLADGVWNIQVNITVYNVGPSTGSQTVLLMWRPSDSAIHEKLIAFQGTGPLHPGQHEVLQFNVQNIDFALWNNTSRMGGISAVDPVLMAKASNVEVKMTLRTSNSDIAANA